MPIIFFDFDGVIVDTYDTSFGIFKHANETLTEEEFKKYFEGSGNENVFKAQKPRMSIASFFTSYRTRVLDLPVVPGIGQVLKELSLTHRIIIVSSTPANIIDEFLKLHSLSAYVSKVFGGGDRRNKVDKLLFCLEKHQCAPGASVYVTDTLGDVHEATEAGIQSIAVTWGYHDTVTLQQGNPLIIVSDPSEVVTAVNNYFV